MVQLSSHLSPGFLSSFPETDEWFPKNILDYLHNTLANSLSRWGRLISNIAKYHNFNFMEIKLKFFCLPLFEADVTARVRLAAGKDVRAGVGLHKSLFIYTFQALLTLD